MLRRIWQSWRHRKLLDWVNSCTSPTLSTRRSGFEWTLEPRSCITENIVTTGVFEEQTTERLMWLLKPGMTAIDVGANVGYFTLLMARAVTPAGRVIAFEPTRHYRAFCKRNISQNGFAEIVELRCEALSDSAKTLSISIGNASASLHWTATEKDPRMSESIQTRPLDELVDELHLSRLDLMKVDIDGHEPAFLRGAKLTISRFRPIIVMEFAQHCLHVAGSSVLDLKHQFSDLNYSIISEKSLALFQSDISFLLECGNYAHSANALVVPNERLQEIVLCGSLH